MPYITNKTKQESVEIFYQNYGSGRPVILIHGWPLSNKAWEPQVADIVAAGYRCITYDRRGFGASSTPDADCYDYSSLTSDLNELIQQLELTDATIVGFSMGGGEVVRYFTDYQGKGVKQAALISSIIPLVAHKDDNPAGVAQEDLNGILNAVKNDRVTFLKEFHQNFYNYSESDETVSTAVLDNDFIIASQASPLATIDTAIAWAETDFRDELKNVDVPTLILHGDADNIVPIETAGDQAAEGIKDNIYHVIKDAPHGMNLTHRKEVNKHLINFLKKFD